MSAARMLGTWNGWVVVQAGDEEITWLVNPLTGHRRRMASGCCSWCGAPIPELGAGSHGVCRPCKERLWDDQKAKRNAV